MRCLDSMPVWPRYIDLIASHVKLSHSQWDTVGTQWVTVKAAQHMHRLPDCHPGLAELSSAWPSVWCALQSALKGICKGVCAVSLIKFLVALASRCLIKLMILRTANHLEASRLP